MANEAAAIERGGKRMGNMAPRSETMPCDTRLEEERSYTWLEGYLERLDGKDAYREFQERFYGTPEYYALVASLAA